jgi:hypothetical protein
LTDYLIGLVMDIRVSRVKSLVDMMFPPNRARKVHKNDHIIGAAGLFARRDGSCIIFNDLPRPHCKDGFVKDGNEWSYWFVRGSVAFSVNMFVLNSELDTFLEMLDYVTPALCEDKDAIELYSTMRGWAAQCTGNEHIDGCYSWGLVDAETARMIDGECDSLERFAKHKMEIVAVSERVTQMHTTYRLAYSTREDEHSWNDIVFDDKCAYYIATVCGRSYAAILGSGELREKIKASIVVDPKRDNYASLA